MTELVIDVREESAADDAAVRGVNERGFGAPAEADLVDALRRRGAVTLSLVALVDAEVVGHLLATPATIVADRSVEVVALGPMAVAPEHQRRGVGTALVHRGLQLLREAGHAAVFLVGHPDYYPRFGFVPASRFGIACTFEVPDEAFLALELREGALRGCGGTLHYQPEFAEG